MASHFFLVVTDKCCRLDSGQTLSQTGRRLSRKVPHGIHWTLSYSPLAWKHPSNDVSVRYYEILLDDFKG
jgi:hypothetical protein